MSEEWKGDFLSFTFNGKNSSNFNIVRTSDNDRFNESLQPEVNDIVVEVPGMDGGYYFGSTYGKKTFSISFAFDHLTEIQFRKLREWLGIRHMGELILSERPYKRYMVKIENPVELSYVCFDEPKRTVSDVSRDGVRVIKRVTSTEEIDGEEITTTTIYREPVYPYEYDYSQKERVYKGEGKIEFVSYFPFAKSCFKVLDTEELRNSQWASSSGILSAETRENRKIDIFEENRINVYNPGDLSTGFRLYIPANAVNQQITLSYEARFPESDTLPQLVINPIVLKNNDAGVIIDTNTGLISGIKPSTMTIAKIDSETGEIVEVKEVDEALHIDYNGNVYYTTSGNIYNEYVKSGYFFKLQPDIAGDLENGSVINITNGNSEFQIFYDYLYF